MAEDDISPETLFNQSSEGDGSARRLAFVQINSIGVCTHRTPITVNTSDQEITISTGKKTMEIRNTGSVSIYFGGSGVTSSNGIEIRANESRIFANVKETFSIYVVTASGTSTLRVIEYD